jgi:hypothetical protein
MWLSDPVSNAAVVCAAILMWSVPASAQYRAAPSPAVGEQYHIEAALAWWSPEPNLIVSSESLGIPGDDVDLVTDLGIEKKRLRELRLVLRPAAKHKFRINYLPIKYSAEAIVQREFVFNGQRYRIGLPVNTETDLTTWRFGYEYDFIHRSRGFLGVLLDLKYTNVDVVLDSPIGREFTSQVAPIPTIGVVGRGYIVPNFSITGEVSFFKVPENLGEQLNGEGRYLDYDFYATYNLNRNVGGQLGLRSIDVQYSKDLDAGTLNFKGWYFGGVIRY